MKRAFPWTRLAAWTLTAAVACVQGAAPGRAAPAAKPAAWREKIVYYDAAYDAVHIRNPQALVGYLVANGFQPKRAVELGAWMGQKLQGGAAGSVAVMTLGAAPESVFPHDQGRESPLYRYLAAGGRVLFLGEMPGIYCQSETSPSIVNCEPGLETFGVRGGWHLPIWGNRKTVELTGAGRRWGLVHPGGPLQAAHLEDVTTALSGFNSDDAKTEVAVSWFKNFNPDHPWSGLIWALKGADLADPATQEEVYRLALYAGEPVQAPKGFRPEEKRPPVEIVIALAGPHDRSCYVRGESIPAHLAVRRNDPQAPQPDRLACQLSDGRRSVAARTVQVPAVEPLPSGKSRDEPAWSIDTVDLACGEYLLRVEGFAGDTAACRAERSVWICPRPAEPEFFYSAWNPDPDNPHRVRLTLEGMARAGLHPGSCGESTNPRLMDQCLRYGLRFSLRTHGDAAGPFEPGSDRVAPDGRPVPSAWGGGRPMTSLASPILRRQTADGVERNLKSVAGYPALWPYCHTNDDYSVRYGLDYSEVARAQFKAATGMEAPAPKEIVALGPDLNNMVRIARAPGVVPEDDPWLLWSAFTTRDLGGGYNKALMEGARRAIPGIRLGPVPGGMQLPLWHPGQYPPHQFGRGGFNCLWYYYYLNYWQPLSTALYWDEVARMANRDLPLYVTAGLVGADEPTYYRNKFFLHLAGGVQGLNYFTYQEGLLRPRAIEEVGRLGIEVVRPYYPLLGKLRPRRREVGLLLPYTQSAYDTGYPLAAPYAYANLLAAHVDVEPTCEEELVSGDAKRYKAVLLWRVKWLRQTAYDSLARYAREGGLVLADAFTEIDVPGMKRLPVDLAMGQAAGAAPGKPDPARQDPGIHDYLLPERVRAVREAVSQYVRPEVDSPSMHMAIRQSEAGGVRYVWLVHLHTHEDYEFLRPRVGAGARPADPKQAAREAAAYLDARDKAAAGQFTAEVGLPAGGVLYDVLAGKEVPVTTADGRSRFTASMKLLGGQLVAIYPRRIAAVKIEAPAALARGVEGKVKIRVVGDDGKPLAGCQPVHVEVRFPAGTSAEWSGSYATSDGLCEIPIRPARNHPSGSWSVRVRELSSSAAAEARINVQ